MSHQKRLAFYELAQKIEEGSQDLFIEPARRSWWRRLTELFRPWTGVVSDYLGFPIYKQGRRLRSSRRRAARRIWWASGWEDFWYAVRRAPYRLGRWLVELVNDLFELVIGLFRLL